MAPVVSGIYIYPVKSCGGIAMPSASLTPWGLEYDRHWMVVKPNGKFLTQRELPSLALVSTAIEAGSLKLSTPHQAELRVPLAGLDGPTHEVEVWGDRVQAVDQGQEAADWFTEHTGIECRLVRMTPEFDRPVDPDYAPEPAQVSFADAYPLLMISEASLADLNSRMTFPLPMDRFRPNLVVSDCEPYAEDTWRSLRVGDVEFYGVKACTRCIITTTDQTTAERPSNEPLATLATYRRIDRGIIFGQNLVHRSLGTLTVGDAIAVLATTSVDGFSA